MGAYGYVYALAVSGTDLYAGGSFEVAGGIAATNIAKWDGSRWSALGSGIGPYRASVRALAVSGTNLFLGGSFANAGIIPVNGIARWDGSSWSALGSGITGLYGGSVYALAVWGTNLFVGGSFTNAGGIAVNGIARWDGSSWSSVGSGISGPSDYTYHGGFVQALVVSGNDLYVGGRFTTAGGNAANNIAKWDGSNWSTLGSAIGWVSSADAPAVLAMAMLKNDLYTGGYFTTAGGKVSVGIARVRIGSIATSIVATNSTSSIQFSGVTGYQYDVQRAVNLAPPITWTTVTATPLSPAPDGSFSFTDTNAPPGMAHYRTVEH
jgi:hypothetical protein